MRACCCFPFSFLCGGDDGTKKEGAEPQQCHPGWRERAKLSEGAPGEGWGWGQVSKAKAKESSSHECSRSSPSYTISRSTLCRLPLCWSPRFPRLCAPLGTLSFSLSFSLLPLILLCDCRASVVEASCVRTCLCAPIWFAVRLCAFLSEYHLFSGHCPLLLFVLCICVQWGQRGEGAKRGVQREKDGESLP